MHINRAVLRDIVCNEIPSAFNDHRPYALCEFAGGWVVVAMHGLGLSGPVTLLTGAAGASVPRLLAMRYDWRLAAWQPDEPPAR